MRISSTIRFAGAALLLALFLGLAPAASAQCAMCANSAASQQAEARKALNMGIAALVAPVLFLIGGFVFLTYKRRNAPDDPSGEPTDWAGSVPFHSPAVKLPLKSTSERPRPSA